MTPQNLYKYQNFNNYTISNLKNNQLWFSKPNSFNDIYDCFFQADEESISKEQTIDYFRENHPEYPKEITGEEVKMVQNAFYKGGNTIRDEVLNKMGVTCFSEEYDNILMWAHYGDNGKGFCLEFDTQWELFSKVVKVKYSKELPKLTFNYLKNEENEILKVLSTKYESWSYEKEYRAFHEESNKLYGYNNACLSAVYFGPRMDYTHKEIICLILKGQNPHVKFYEGYMDEKIYKIKFKEVNYISYLEYKEINNTKNEIIKDNNI